MADEIALARERLAAKFGGVSCIYYYDYDDYYYDYDENSSEAELLRDFNGG